MKRVYVYLITAMLTLVMTASQCGCGIDEPDYFDFGDDLEICISLATSSNNSEVAECVLDTVVVDIGCDEVG